MVISDSFSFIGSKTKIAIKKIKFINEQLSKNGGKWICV